MRSARDPYRRALLDCGVWAKPSLAGHQSFDCHLPRAGFRTATPATQRRRRHAADVTYRLRRVRKEKKDRGRKTDNTVTELHTSPHAMRRRNESLPAVSLLAQPVFQSSSVQRPASSVQHDTLLSVCTFTSLTSLSLSPAPPAPFRTDQRAETKTGCSDSTPC